jgi:predicted SnoaL-like aldol condensation-catalyzing enzyme
MTDLDVNKRVVRSYYEEAFNGGDPEGAVERYVGNRYIQHNPQAADGPDAFIGFVRWIRGEFPQIHLDIKRMIAEGDLVVTHSHLENYPDDRGTAVVDNPFPNRRPTTTPCSERRSYPSGEKALPPGPSTAPQPVAHDRFVGFARTTSHL